MKRPPLFSQVRKPLFWVSLALSLSFHVGGLYLFIRHSSSFLHVRSLEQKYRQNHPKIALLTPDGTPQALSQPPLSCSYPALQQSLSLCTPLTSSFPPLLEQTLDLEKKNRQLHGTQRRTSLTSLTHVNWKLQLPPFSVAELKKDSGPLAVSHMPFKWEKEKQKYTYCPDPEIFETKCPTELQKDFFYDTKCAFPILSIPTQSILKKHTWEGKSQSEVTFPSLDEMNKLTCSLGPLFPFEEIKERGTEPVQEKIFLEKTLCPQAHLIDRVTAYRPDFLETSKTIPPLSFLPRIPRESPPSVFKADCHVPLLMGLISKEVALNKESPQDTKKNGTAHQLKKEKGNLPLQKPLIPLDIGKEDTPHFLNIFSSIQSPSLSPFAPILPKKSSLPQIPSTPFKQFDQKPQKLCDDFVTIKAPYYFPCKEDAKAHSFAKMELTSLCLDIHTKTPKVSLFLYEHQIPFPIFAAANKPRSSAPLISKQIHFSSKSASLPPVQLSEMTEKKGAKRAKYIPSLPGEEEALPLPFCWNQNKQIPLVEKKESFQWPWKDQVSPLYFSCIPYSPLIRSRYAKPKKLIYTPCSKLPKIRQGELIPTAPHKIFSMEKEEKAISNLCWKQSKDPLIVGKKGWGEGRKSFEPLLETQMHKPLPSFPPSSISGGISMSHKREQAEKTIEIPPSSIPKIEQKSEPPLRVTHEISPLEKEADVQCQHSFWQPPHLPFFLDKGIEFDKKRIHFVEKKGALCEIFAPISSPPVFQGQISIHAPFTASIAQIPEIDRPLLLGVELKELKGQMPWDREGVENHLIEKMITSKNLGALQPQIDSLASEDKQLGHSSILKEAFPLSKPNFQAREQDASLSKGEDFIEALQGDLQMVSFQNHFTADVAYVENPNGSGYHFALTLQPNEKWDYAPPEQNFIFILDRSGSIKKHRYHTFKAALIKAIPYMNKGDSFNIILADSEIVSMSKTPLVWTPKVIKEVRTYLSQREYRGYFADKSGFRMLTEMTKFFDPNKENVVLFLTDGQSFKNIKKQRALFKKLSQKSRRGFSLFTAAASQGNNTTMLGLVSALNNGEFMYSSTHAAFPRKFAILIKHIKNLFAKDMHLQALPKNKASIQLYPSKAAYPPLYADHSYTVYGSTDKLEDFDLIVQGRLQRQWIHIKQHISFEDAKRAGHELQRRCALQRAYAHYFDYLENNDPHVLKQAEALLHHYQLHSNIR